MNSTQQNVVPAVSVRPAENNSALSCHSLRSHDGMRSVCFHNLYNPAIRYPRTDPKEFLTAGLFSPIFTTLPFYIVCFNHYSRLSLCLHVSVVATASTAIPITSSAVAVENRTRHCFAEEESCSMNISISCLDSISLITTTRMAYTISRRI